MGFQPMNHRQDADATFHSRGRLCYISGEALSEVSLDEAGVDFAFDEEIVREDL